LPDAPNRVRIRKAKKPDAEGIARVHVRSWQSAYRGILPDDFLAELDLDQRTQRWGDILANLGSRQHLWVAESTGIVGFVQAGPNRDKEAPVSAGEVYAIYLDPDVVGTGLGRRLFTRAVGRLRRESYLYATLWVLEENHRARRFYEAAGWSADGRSERWERFNLVALRYRVDLSSPQSSIA